MNRNLIFSFLFVLLAFVSVAQKKIFFHQLDSIHINYRSNGISLDSVDAFFTQQPNLRPGAGRGGLFEKKLYENLFLNSGGLSYLSNQNIVVPKFTGLPYLGFQYAFGSQLTQNLNVEYQHFYSPNTHLHFKYSRNTGNGFLRNGSYKLNDVSFKFYHEKGRLASNISGHYGAYNIAQNGGITTDSLIEDFGLEFTPVFSENAQSKIRKVELKSDNYFRLVGDSIIGSGFKTKHQYNLIGREFTEQISNLSQIDTFYIDSGGNTRDQYQTASISNGAGVYLSTENFEIDATINHKYWRNQNLGTNRDTNEIFIHSNMWLSLNKQFTLCNEFYFNLLGATGELKNNSKLNYRILDALFLNAQLNFENLYPNPYQRYHVANYYKWEINNLKMQQNLQLKGSLKYGNDNSKFIELNAAWATINNGLFFIDGKWRQDTLNFVSVGALQLKGGFKIGKWSFYPNATVRFNSKNFNYQPSFSTLNRVSFSTKLFKAQKLELAIGADIGYETAYQFLNYNGVLDLYQPVQTAVQTESLIQLNSFFAISIDEFRFFIKAENLSYLFQNQTIRIDTNYPVTPLLIRIGITWDFFN